MGERLFDNAQWIMAATDLPRIRDRYFLYQARFMSRPADDVRLYISAHSQYAVYLNGQFVDWGQMDDYESMQLYDTLELTPFLGDGENCLEIHQYVCGENCSTRRRAVPGVIFAVWAGEEEWLGSSCQCLSGLDPRYLENGEYITWQQGFNFSYDATLPKPELFPSVLAGKEKHLVPRPIKKLSVEPLTAGRIIAQGIFLENDPTLPKAQRMQTAYLSASRRMDLGAGEGPVFSWAVPEGRRADGVYLVADLGGECAGLLALSLDVPERTEVLIGIGEHLDDLRVRSFVGERNFCFRYIAHAGHNEFFHPLQRLGLRYIQLHISSMSGTLYSVGLRQTIYPLIQRPVPVTDGLHRRIWEVGVHTLRLCMHEHYEDCPWREQALYTMDSRIQILSGYYAFGETVFPKASLKLMMPALREDGLLELCPPGVVPTDIPCFTAVYVREVLEYTRQTGDWSLAREVFDGMKAIVDGFMSRLDGTGLIPLYCGEKYWNFYEWRPGLDGEEQHTRPVYESPLGAFVSDAFSCFAELCRTLRPELAETYETAHKALNEALHQAFYHRESGAYLTRLGDEKPRHELTQGLMLYVDAVPPEETGRVEQAIVGKGLIPATLSMSIYVYEALLKKGVLYRAYVLNEIEKIWGRMLAAGADTFWETEAGGDDFEWAGSLCHGWSTVPIYLFGKYGLHQEKQ